MGGESSLTERKRKMGERVHIVARYEHKEIHEDGMRGFNKKTLYSAEQRDWFNNNKCRLADWFNDYADLDCWIDCGKEEWMIQQNELENIPEEAFRHPIEGTTEEEMRRFIAECIRCAKLTEGECILEWF